ncbi:Vitamin B12-binding protein precursor [Pseudooceanicola marinus]|uniref:Vitamin B12-binding protein n=1 Tax=Pseudooceanicola marinus TaxID=396013 RepID=A0A1X6YD18_9RHOB|nr:ABC transporter substrate-binding protein [Pseudooceanicola marinus]PJE32960.1 ABC transporter substrate-binding protein [Pseudooceanicola marinus]SLN17436.1 Vitamin B12-binding protein precursor [Pseudooceanicola marinus]
MLRRAALALALCAAGLPVAAEEGPRRVVSINLCTDQIAMQLAAPGQLHSVSWIARDPRSSAMAQEAQAYPANHGRAEEIWLMKPDLVLAGSFTSRAAVEMLKRLGTPVVEVAPAYSLDDIPDRIRSIGTALGREAQAEEMIATFEGRLATLRAQVDDRPSAAIYYANGYTTGDRTLAGEILITAGFDNIAGDTMGGHLPLETLAMADPDAIITGTPYPGASRSEEILEHPVVEAIRDRAASRAVSDSDWICGTPYVLKAIDDLAAFRKGLE